MGSKTPAKNLRKNTFRCDICHRCLLSQAALESHQQCVHSATLRARARACKPTTPVRPSPRPKPQPPKPMNNAKISKTTHTPATKRTRSSRLPNAEKKDLPIKSEAVELNDKAKDVRMMFECPVAKCSKLFPVCFQAQRHIQKNHRQEELGKADSVKMKPRRIEICQHCNNEVLESVVHTCGGKVGILIKNECQPDASSATIYICTLCRSQYRNSSAFDRHVMSVHCDKVESLFFHKDSEFRNWKDNIEKQMLCNYNPVGDLNISKQIYRCGHFTTHFENSVKNVPEFIANFCPSIMIVQIFDKGTQVHFYPTHSDHTIGDYIPLEQFDKNKIASFDVDNENKVDAIELGLYHQLKGILDNVLDLSSSSGVDRLKTLIEMSNQMVALLNEDNNEESKTPQATKKTLTDNQISNALNKSTLTNSRKRRKTGELETQRLDNNVDSKKDILRKGTQIENINNGESPKQNILVRHLDQSPSFNDSYKEFVEKNISVAKNAMLQPEPKNAMLQPEPKNAMLQPEPKKKLPKVLKKKMPLKTKIGQFKPSLSPKKVCIEEPLVEVKVEKYEVVEQDDDCNILVLRI